MESTETKGKPTDKDRLKIFLLYVGQPFFQPSRHLDEQRNIIMHIGTNGNYSVKGLRPGRPEPTNDFYIRDFTLKLKSLTKISDEDIWEALLFENARNLSLLKDTRESMKKVMVKTAREKTFSGDCKYLTPLLTDFLRERGYAVPYKKWSVGELEEFGIFKLIE